MQEGAGEAPGEDQRFAVIQTNPMSLQAPGTSWSRKRGRAHRSKSSFKDSREVYLELTKDEIQTEKDRGEKLQVAYATNKGTCSAC